MLLTTRAHLGSQDCKKEEAQTGRLLHFWHLPFGAPLKQLQHDLPCSHLHFLSTGWPVTVEATRGDHLIFPPAVVSAISVVTGNDDQFEDLGWGGVERSYVNYRLLRRQRFILCIGVIGALLIPTLLSPKQPQWIPPTK